MDAVNLESMLNMLSSLRVEYGNMPEVKMATILHQLDPDTADKIRGIMGELDEREAQLKAEIAAQETAIKTYVLATGAGGHGTYLQAIIIAPRITWDTKAMEVYSTLHPEVLPYRKVGEPSVQIRACSLTRRAS